MEDASDGAGEPQRPLRIPVPLPDSERSTSASSVAGLGRILAGSSPAASLQEISPVYLTSMIMCSSLSFRMKDLVVASMSDEEHEHAFSHTVSRCMLSPSHTLTCTLTRIHAHTF